MKQINIVASGVLIVPAENRASLDVSKALVAAAELGKAAEQECKVSENTAQTHFEAVKYHAEDLTAKANSTCLNFERDAEAIQISIRPQDVSAMKTSIGLIVGHCAALLDKIGATSGYELGDFS